MLLKSRCCIRRFLLLHGLVFRKPQSHSLGHLDVPCSTVFDTRTFVFVECFGAEGADTSLKAAFDEIIVHSKQKRKIILGNVHLRHQTLRVKQKNYVREAILELHVLEVLHELLLLVSWKILHGLHFIDERCFLTEKRKGFSQGRERERGQCES